MLPLQPEDFPFSHPGFQCGFDTRVEMSPRLRQQPIVLVVFQAAAIVILPLSGQLDHGHAALTEGEDSSKSRSIAHTYT